MLPIVEQVEQALPHLKHPLQIAIMGCVVNGPGEARQADVGLAGGKGMGLLFRQGEPLRKVKEAEMAEALVAEIKRLDNENKV